MPYPPPPIIETAHLALRPFAPADLDTLAGIYADSAVMATIRGGTRSREQTAENIQAYAEEWRDHGHGVWAVTERPSGALLGMCGFVARAELGYRCHRCHRREEAPTPIGGEPLALASAPG